MNCLSLNIRGCGDSHKIDWIRKLKNLYKIDFIGLQETWVADSTNIDITGAWGNMDFEVEFVNPVGRSGGIVSIWDPSIFSKSHCFSSRHYLAISGQWIVVPGITTFVNVYGPQSVSDKRKLLKELINLKNNQDGIWIFFLEILTLLEMREREPIPDFVVLQQETSINSLMMPDFRNSTLVEKNSLICVRMA